VNTTRRTMILGASALVPLALSGCGAVTTTTVNGITTVTVNVATATADLSGLAAAAAIFVMLPGVGALLGPSVATAVPLVIAKVNAAIPALQQAAGGTQTFAFTTASAPAFVADLLGAVQKLTGDAVAVLPKIGSTGAAANVSQYGQAVQSLGTAILALFGAPVPMAAALGGAPQMSVPDALALVGIKAPA